jgi:hypothetical protein
MTIDPISEQHAKEVWNAFGRALGAEPREALSIRGASGLDHAVEAISVDDKNGRVIIFAAESNPRIAALMQVDIQATMPGARVLLARPIAFDAASFARRFVEQMGRPDIDLQEWGNSLKDPPTKPGEVHPALTKLLGPFVAVLENVKLPPMNQVLAFVQQAALIDWVSALKSGSTIPLANLLTMDSMEADRAYGICPIPMYELSDRDWELLLSGGNLGDIQERLKALGVFQYFFPPPDQIALGMVERDGANVASISSAVDAAPKIGHPLGPSELVSSSGTFMPEMVAELIDHGLLVEGEFGLEVTPSGTNVRSMVKFRPREGVLSKLIQRFSVNANVSVSPKDFFPPSSG